MSSPRLAFACLLVPVWAAAQSAPSGEASAAAAASSDAAVRPGGDVTRSAGAKALEQLPYQDQLMNSAGGAEAAEGAEPESGGPEPEGFRATVLETRAGRRSNNVGSAGNDLGVFLLHRRETLNYGEILVETAYQSASRTDPFGAGTNRSGRLTLSQIGMPLAGGWSLGNSIGLLRSKATSVFAGARRFVLPGVLLEGLGSYLRSPVSGFAAETGRIVRLEGQTGYGLTRTTGRATTVAGSHRIGGSLVTALQLIDVRDSPETGSYTGWSGLVGGRHFSDHLRWRLQYVANSGKRVGVWAESEYLDGYEAWRGAVWRIDRGLSWYSTVLSAGQQGLWARYDHVDPSSYWGAGAEVDRADPLVTGRAPMRTNAFSIGAGTRLDLRRSIGANLHWRGSNPSFDDGASESRRHIQASAYLSRTLRGVVDRVQYNLSSVRSGTDSRVQELVVSRDLSVRQDWSLGMTAGVGVEDGDTGRRFRPTLGVSYGGPLGEGRQLQSWVRYARTSDPFRNEYALAASLQLSAALGGGWSVGANASWNLVVGSTGSTQPLFGQADDRVRERSLWLTLRWADSRGSGYLAGQPGNGRGAGSVGGMVFEDANGDGVRQPNERPVPGARVMLDGVLETVTGPDGRYEFAVVRAGRHRLALDPATVRLPWGPPDDPYPVVDLSPRGQARADLAVVKVGE
ncbi:MAG: hypothetical protein H6934_08495 [Burkholderiaceae bacterium]|nr:hypothetical protein [Burkholderiaceae bacterium]